MRFLFPERMMMLWTVICHSQTVVSINLRFNSSKNITKIQVSNLFDTYVHSIMLLYMMCIVFKLRILGMICLLLIHGCVHGHAQHTICTLGKQHLCFL